MYYYRAKDGKSKLALKNELTVENYPEYTAEMVAKYDVITESDFYGEHQSNTTASE